MTALLYRFRETLPFHNLLVIFLPVRVRHAQEIDAGGNVPQVHRGGRAGLGRTCVCARARHHPPLQVVKGNAGDLRTAQFHEQEVVSGVGIDGQDGVIGLNGLGFS